MSKPSIENITCPQCGSGQEFTIWQSVNVTLDPELKEQLLRGQLTAFTCSRCGHTSDVAYSLLYHDMTRKFMVMLSYDDGPPEPELGPMAGIMSKMMSDMRLRMVRSRNELVEKILLFDAELDDRVIEVCKLVVSAQLKSAGETVRGIFFSGLDETEGDQKQLGFVVLSGEEQKGLGLAWSTYEHMATELAPRLRDLDKQERPWLCVDSRYAGALVSSS